MTSSTTTFGDGKYAIVHQDGAELHVLRNGELWLGTGNVQANKMLVAAAHEIDTLRAAIASGESEQNAKDVITAKITEIRDILDETYNFATTSPRGQQNINEVSELLSDIAAIAQPVQPAAHKLDWSTLVAWWESGAEDWEELRGIVLAITTQPAAPDHDSDCAVHNSPAEPAGPCDCRLAQPAFTDEDIGEAADEYKKSNPNETQKTFFWAGALWAVRKAQTAQPVQPAVSDALQSISDALHNPADGDDLLDRLEALRPMIENELASRALPASGPEPALQAAAQAVLDRWNSPKWEWSQQGPTAALMHDLRRAIDTRGAPAQAAGVRAQVLRATTPTEGS